MSEKMVDRQTILAFTYVTNTVCARFIRPVSFYMKNMGNVAYT